MQQELQALSVQHEVFENFTPKLPSTEHDTPFTLNTLPNVFAEKEQ